MFRFRNALAQTLSNSDEFPWHTTCSADAVSPSSQHRSIDVFVVDAPSAAGVALGAPRTDAESTHVLCRHGDEATPEFIRRVLRRIARIQSGRRLRSLCYVVGPKASRRGSARLLQALMQLLDGGTHLTVLRPGDSQGEVYSWIDSVLPRRHTGVTGRPRLYAADAVEPRSPSPGAPRPSHSAVPARTR
jgi:hypothetical protein